MHLSSAVGTCSPADLAGKRLRADPLGFRLGLTARVFGRYAPKRKWAIQPWLARVSVRDLCRLVQSQRESAPGLYGGLGQPLDRSSYFPFKRPWRIAYR